MNTTTIKDILEINTNFMKFNFPELKRYYMCTNNKLALESNIGFQSILSFDSNVNSAFSFLINENYLEKISKTLNLHLLTIENLKILNKFLKKINQNKLFKEVFKPIAKIDLSLLTKLNPAHFLDNHPKMVSINTESLFFNLISKITDLSHKSCFQLAFKYTKDNQLIPIVSLSLMSATNFDWRVSFNIKDQSISLTLNNATFFEDYIQLNNIVKSTDIDDFVNFYVDSFVELFNCSKESAFFDFQNDKMTFKEKINILSAIYIN